MMKKLVLLFLLTTAFGYSQTTDQEYDALTKKSPFNKMYPKATAADAAAYFGAWNKIFTQGPIALKEARLAAISASAAMKCEYCITAQVHLAKAAGATDDEIKAAIFIAAEVARFSTLLYGNEFGMDNLKGALGIQPK
ncbi:MAG: carboxymuconolactone decarboxylase family protein [Flavobacteriaceae bacterium]|jgi:AhpD family alkylhydroperoxidase